MNTQDSTPLAARRIESIKHDNLLINFTTEFRRTWDSTGSKSKPAAFWRPSPAPDLLPGFFPLGDVVASGLDNINEKRMVMVVCEGELSSDSGKEPALRAPIDFEQVWSDAGSGARANCTIWQPIAPSGYVALGQLCSNGRDKPLPSDIRCVRRDLVAPSFISDLIWDDKGSGARQAFSAWGIYPPDTAAGEILCAPGTFIGVGSHTKPVTHITAYALRMPIPLDIQPSPVAPELTGNEQPLLFESGKITQTAKLPWFTVKDPSLRPFEQLRTSPFYMLERTDQYVLVGYGKNDSGARQTYHWPARRPQSMANADVFSRITSISIDGQWPKGAPSLFTARLSTSFALVDASGGWGGPTHVEVAVVAAKNKAVAAYELQSTFRLLRENKTQVPCELYYIDGNSLHLTEYPPEQETEVITPSVPETDSRTPTNTAP
ncbi:Vps62-related protein [Pseudomonas sp. WJP1]|uniref:Vps62-related protein n=1 Tax=Pseudomonas sp. WJP1 TaxID=2986947 RepID=UPI0023496763|nr:Vps62-related protein [Pseudomonas sp. WJP1]WCM51700.1 Vps62-related protein [Pseudomonas sp. WJP1]